MGIVNPASPPRGLPGCARQLLRVPPASLGMDRPVSGQATPKPSVTWGFLSRNCKALQGSGAQPLGRGAAPAALARNGPHLASSSGA